MLLPKCSFIVSYKLGVRLHYPYQLFTVPSTSEDLSDNQSTMKCDAVVEKIKARVAGIDASGPRKVLGVFQLNIEAADGLHELGE